RHLAALGEREGLVGGIDRKAGLVRRQAFQDAGLALQETDDVALAQPHLAREIIDDLVMHHLFLDAVGNRRGDILAERPHFAGHSDEWHGPPRAILELRRVSRWRASDTRPRRPRHRTSYRDAPGAQRTAQVGSISICRGNGLLISSE